MSAGLCCPAHLLVVHLSLFVSLMGVWDSKPGEITDDVKPCVTQIYNK